MTSKIRSEVVCITPEIAKAYLETNQGNRNIRPSQVSFLANSMIRGDWVLTHQGIAISSDGILIDGQHRLLAVIKANMAIRMMVTYGLDRKSAFPAIDGGFILRSDSDRIGEDKRTVESARFIGYEVFTWGAGNKTRKFTNTQLKQLCNVIIEPHDELINFCPTMASFFSSALVRSAAVSSILIGYDKDYVLQSYRDLVLSNIDNLSQCGKSIIKQFMTGKLSLRNRDLRNLECFSKMMYVFDRKNSNVSRIYINNYLDFSDNIREKLIKKFPFIEYDKLKAKSDSTKSVTSKQEIQSSLSA